MDDVWHLQQIDWLSELDDEDWKPLRERATRRAYAAGEAVFAPARDPKSVYLLESGRVRIYRLSSGGEEATLGYVAPGEVFGELAGFGAFARESFSEAQARSQIWRIPVDVFRALVTARPSLVLAVTRQIGARMKRVESRVENLILRNVRARLAIVLLELAEDFGSSNETGEQTLDLQLSQSELATLVGTSRQSVNSSLARLKKEGLLRQEGRRLTLCDPTRLRELVVKGPR